MKYISSNLLNRAGKHINESSVHSRMLLLILLSFSLVPALVLAQDDIPAFFGTSPPVSDSNAILTLNNDIANDKTFSWSSADSILGVVQLNLAQATTWRYFPGNPDRLVFIAQNGSTRLNGNIIFGDYSRSVVDVVFGGKRVRYLLKASSQVLDLDIDSDNDNGVSNPLRSDKEEAIEDDGKLPGKIIAVNDDSNDGEATDDFGDGYNLDGVAGNEDDANAAEEDFIPLILTIAADVDVTKANLKIGYSASDPAGATINAIPPKITPAAGSIRIWTRTGNQARNAAKAPAGHYVKPDTYAAADLGFTAGNRTVTFFIEAINSSAASGADQISVEVDPDGAGPLGFAINDRVRLTSVKVSYEEDPNDQYGYDEYHHPTTVQSLPPQDFISVRKGNRKNTNTAVVKITPFVKDGIHFKSVDTSVATPSPQVAAASPQTLTVTGKSFAPKHKSAIIESRVGDENGQVATRLSSEVYKLKQVGRVNYYRVHDSHVANTSPALNPTLAIIRDFLRENWKQTVMTVSRVGGDANKDIRFDLNGNTLLDFYRPGPNLELQALQNATVGPDRVAYVKGVRDNYRLAQNAAAGDRDIKLRTVSFIEVNDTLQIGSATGAAENVRVTAINTATNTITVQNPLASAHPSATHTIYTPRLGLATDPQLITDGGLGEDELLKTVSHEMLHRPKIGRLADLDAQGKDNIMYYTSGGGERIRFRRIRHQYAPAGDDQQWNLIPLR